MHQIQNKKERIRRKRIIQTIIGVVVFLLLSLSGFLLWAGKFFNYIGRPIWKAKEVVSKDISGKSYLVSTKSSLLSENQRLINENTELRNSMLGYSILKSENDQLKELMGRIPVKDKFILGTILTKPNISPYDTLIVDIGKAEGISEGDKVFANAEVPIGEVSKVYQNNSLVVLYSNPGQITEATIEGSNASVELVGRGGGNFEMTIPEGLDANVGTSVVLPNINSQIIAVVQSIISAPTDPAKKVVLKSPINIQNLKWIQIKKN
jgi:cell shape-determining protein MreC